jgi:hypothetical protein
MLRSKKRKNTESIEAESENKKRRPTLPVLESREKIKDVFEQCAEIARKSTGYQQRTQTFKDKVPLVTKQLLKQELSFDEYEEMCRAHRFIFNEY